ncbi:MAG: type II toxin-antitoxin system VapB family antitoxin [Acidimicrobiia bacterium]|nr:type II toxin-antitoxin system VapB family antitoxin [Acidimicrobiia bacterium]
MRTNIEIDDDLLALAQEVAGTRTKRATVHYALEELVRRKARKQVLELRGAVDWDGDLEQTRRSRVS